MSDALPSFKEDHISQIPALQLLQQLGWKYVSPDQAVAARGGKLSSVFLDSVLTDQLAKMNRIDFKGETYPFSEGNIHTAVQALKDVVYDGLVRTNEKIYDLLVLGKSLPQTIAGDTKSFTLNYIDWNPETWLKNNVFHVTEEFVVERMGSKKTRRPDIVLFVNGIPLCVIECKRPDVEDPIGKAISQHIRNQRDYSLSPDHASEVEDIDADERDTGSGPEIPQLFVFSQLLVGISKNDAAYATTGTPAKFWSVWKENVDKPLKKVMSRPPKKTADTGWLMDRFTYVSEEQASYFTGSRAITGQDRALYSLCRPERLLELTYSYTVFDAGEKKVARYQQFFTVRNAIARIDQRDDNGARKGGVVWHTQGSGKSLTMVMLAKEIARLNLPNYKIVLVTDRVDLDDQIYKTFAHCDMEPVQATTGKHLASLLQGSAGRVITTVIDKFDNAVTRGKLRNESENVFVLVDESHRGQYKTMHAKMRKAMPRGCFIGFTGTPVRKKEKDTIDKFGGLIQPTYSIRDAVEDKAVVPLLYEGRDVEQRVDKEPLDRWFDIITANLTKEQKADLKKKFTTTDQLNKAQQKVREIALDISLHYRDHWQGTKYKAQLVTQDKAAALLYHSFLEDFGMVSSAVLISGPDDREGNEEVDIDEDDLPEIQKFWKKMMAKHGSEDQYNKNIINGFKSGDDPEIIIVVDKLLTGFDAPRNTVLYLTRTLKDHTLLQAIARVNRLCEGKDFGYIIDYRGVLSNLQKAFEFYRELEEADQEELEAAMTDVAKEIEKLPRRHTELVNLFQDIKNKQDEELYERKLADPEVRNTFYDVLRDFARSLSMALSSLKFMEDTPDAKVERYRKDLKFYMNLRTSVRHRYAEVVDFKEYEGKIQKLLDTHVATGEVKTMTTLVNIFDQEAFQKELDELEGNSVGSKADTIAHRTKRTITERMEDDPAFYAKFSKMLEDAIAAFQQKRLADIEYLTQVQDIADKVRTRSGDNLPGELTGHEVAGALYGVVKEVFASHATGDLDLPTIGAAAALRIDDIIKSKRIVNWTNNADVQNQMQTAIEDYLHELEGTGLDLSFDEIDLILEKCLDIARRRYGG